MSEFDEKINQMRSLIIHAPSGTSVFKLLKNSNIKGWKWSETGFPSGSHQNCLKRGKEFVAISYENETIDRAGSSNVMPYDSQNKPQAANKLIQELSKALTEANINNNVLASVNDLKTKKSHN